MSCCECCVLPGRGLCDGLITRPEESYRLWCVVVCGLETSWMRCYGPLRAVAQKKKLFLSRHSRLQTGFRNRPSIPGRDKQFSSKASRSALGYRAFFFRGLKWPGRETVEVMDAWSSTSSPPYAFTGWRLIMQGGQLIFTYLSFRWISSFEKWNTLLRGLEL